LLHLVGRTFIYISLHVGGWKFITVKITVPSIFMVKFYFDKALLGVVHCNFVEVRMYRCVQNNRCRPIGYLLHIFQVVLPGIIVKTGFVILYKGFYFK
jgi:hypothetical protein